MLVIVEFFGTLRTLAHLKRCDIELEDKTTVSMLLHRLRVELFMDKEPISASNLLILVNEKEISILNGTKTELKSNDLVKLIPASHGG